MANYDESLRAQHISTNLANYEAARSGFFTFIVNDLDNIIRADYTGDRSNEDSIAPSSRIANAEEVLKLNVTQASIPHFSLEPLQYRRGNDVVGLDTKSILMAWQALAYDVKTGRGGRMADYKKNCTLIEYTQDFEQIRSWKLYGCWVSDIGEDAFDKESDGKRKLTATIQYDKAEMVLPKEQSTL